MTPEQRIREFNELFDGLPGTNAERLRAVADVLFCAPNTIRIWRMNETHRVIPLAKLRMLQRHFLK